MAWNRPTQRSTSIGVMTANPDKPMDEVVELIIEAQLEAGFGPFSLAKARDHYRYLTVNEMAPGKIPEKTKKPKAEKTPKKPKVKIQVAQTAQIKPKTETKVKVADAEKDAVVAANTKRLLAYRAKQKAKEQDGARKVDADEQHRSERFDISFDDPYSSPDSLTTDQVSALTGY